MSVRVNSSRIDTSDAVVRIGGGTTPVDAALDPTGVRLATSQGGSPSFLVPDLHGNAAALWGQSAAAIIDARRYDPYGETLDAWPASPSVRTPWRYQGRLLEGEPGDTESYDFGFRSYLADIGAFGSIDDVAGQATDVRSLNRFLYAQADPVTLIDPDGHMAEVASGGGGYAPAPKARASGKGGSTSSSSTKSWQYKGYAAKAQKADPGTRRPVLVTTPIRNDDILGGIVEGVWNGTIGGAVGMAQHIGGNLDKIPVGAGVLVSHPVVSMTSLLDASGLDDPLGNLGRGWDAMLAMDIHDKASFWSSIVAGAVATKKLPSIKVPGAPGTTVAPALEDAGLLARGTADAAQGLRPRPGAAGVAVKDGQPFPATSSGSNSLHPEVKSFLDDLPEGRNTFDGGCVEPRCITMMLDEGVDPAGATISTVQCPCSR